MTAFRPLPAELSRRNLLRGGGMGTAALALSGLSGAAFAQREVRDASAMWPNVAVLQERYVGRQRVANMVSAIGVGDAETQYIADGPLSLGGMVQAGPDSLYRIYSMTKPITGMAVMMLIDEGRLGLDQPLKEILPAFSDMRVLKSPTGALTETVPAERDITIRQLLTHTAGLGYAIIQTGPIKQAYETAGINPAQVTRLPIPGIGTAKPAPSLKAFADRLAELPLVYQPGTKWSYSVGLDLLGRVIEVVSGQSFDTFLQERFFEPLGMDSTFFTVPRSEAARLTTNYGNLGGNLLPLDPARASIYLDKPAFPFGGAGLVSSPRDYDRFLQMLGNYGMFEGKRIMSEAAVKLGTSDLLPEGASTAGTWVAGEGCGAGGRSGKGENAGTFGWSGAAGTLAFVNMLTGLRVGMYVQYMPDNSLPLRDEFIAALQKDVAAKMGAAKKDAA